MKQFNVFYVMFFSVLLALMLSICGCSNDLVPAQKTSYAPPQDTGIEQKETDDKDPVTSDTQEQPVPLPQEPETPIVTIPVPVPPLDNPPVIVPPLVPPPVITPPEDLPPLVYLLEINELRTEYSSTSRRAEYIEFKVKQSCNLNGISLHIMYDPKNPFIYNFPAIDVLLGEYITLHLRTLETVSVDELGDNLSLSGGTDSCTTARDLWISGSVKLLHQTDIVYLQDSYGRFIDAIIMNDAPNSEWNKNQSHFTAISENLYNNGMWKSVDGQKPTPYDAVDTSAIKTAATRSVSRYEKEENTHTSADWYITATNGTSPGQPNKE